MADDTINDPHEAGERTHAHTAGPFGFSRPEVIILSIVALAVIVFSAAQWMRRREAAQVPAWSVDDVLIDTLQSNADRRPEEDADHVTTDVNTATRAELMRLPGIGAVLADRIIASRETDGPFASLIDFQRVQGIGPKTASALAGWVRFSASGNGR